MRGTVVVNNCPFGRSARSLKRQKKVMRLGMAFSMGLIMVYPGVYNDIF